MNIYYQTNFATSRHCAASAGVCRCPTEYSGLVPRFPPHVSRPLLLMRLLQLRPYIYVPQGHAQAVQVVAMRMLCKSLRCCCCSCSCMACAEQHRAIWTRQIDITIITTAATTTWERRRGATTSPADAEEERSRRPSATRGPPRQAGSRRSTATCRPSAFFQGGVTQIHDDAP